jgi:hypothetical protein
MMLRLAGVLVVGCCVLLSLGSLFMAPSGQEPREPPPSTPKTDRVPAQDPAPSARPAASNFAADRQASLFDSARAMKYLEELCRIGPRISGSPGMERQQLWLEKHFQSLGGKVAWQRFTARQRSQARPVDMANLVVSWYPERSRRVILCSHYDTRPIADQEVDQRKWREPFVSANDGGSGVALLMEMAHLMKSLQTQVGVGVDFVFFDGEEFIFNPNGDEYFFGSQYFARQYRQERPKFRYAAAVLLDMIGGKDAQFPVEQNSWFKAAALVQDLWQIAAEQRCAAFRNEFGPEVRDDHLALNRADIPAVDIIDFSYPHWHRLSDVPANCSGDGLAQVARVLLTWLQRVK